MQNPRIARRIATLAVAGALAFGAAAAIPAQAANPNSGGTTRATGVDKTSVIVQLAGDPLATSTEVARNGKGRVELANGKTKNVQAQLAAQRNALRSWLKANAPKAKITGEYDIALNAVAVRLNGTSVDKLRSAPGVAAVVYQNKYVPQADPMPAEGTVWGDPDLARIDAPQAWKASGFATSGTDPRTWAGYGIKVGVIDTGIDETHPCFDDSGYPEVKKIGKYTNNKVIVSRVFNNQVNRNGFDAKAIQDHGTHVAGTIACNMLTPANVGGADIPYDPSGVAPGALLGNYSVFPGNIENARTEDIVNAMEAAYADGMDVINMSLGGDAHGVQDLGTLAIDNLDRAGMVVAVSAGNEGPGSFTAGSPGSAQRGLTAGASSVGHYVGVPILSGTTQVTVGAIGDFPVPTSPLTAPLNTVLNADGTLSTACAGITEDLTGQIALISRGGCTFSQKIATAEAKGAAAAIIVNAAPGDPSAMGTDPAFPSTIPAVMAPLDAKAALLALDTKPVTISNLRAYRYTGNNDILMGFSSWGPVDVSYRVKPDVVAPGGNVLSALPQASCKPLPAEGCWGFMSGTSMAAPHLAGMAAVVIHDSVKNGTRLAPWQVRSAIVNTAQIDGVYQTNAITEVERNVQRVGSGLAQLDAAVAAKVAFSDTSVSFGAVAGAAGNVYTQTVSVMNISGAQATFPVAIKDPVGAGTFATKTQSVTLAAGESKTITITYTGPKKSGATQAHLYVGTSHAVLYAYSK